MAEAAMQKLSISDGRIITTPNKNDVLCGRGGSINSHSGNEHFRSMVEKHRRVYLNARFKQEKRLIATSIVSDIRALDPPGRFLAKDGATGAWCDIGDEKARDKTSQALRENAPSIRAGIKGEPKPKPKRKKKAASSGLTARPTYPPVQPPWGPGYNGYYAHAPPHGAQPLHPTAPPPHPTAQPPGATLAHPGAPPHPVISSHPGHYAPPHPYQQAQAPAPAPPGNMVWPPQPVSSAPAVPHHTTSGGTPLAPIQSSESSRSSAQNSADAPTSPNEVRSSRMAHAQEQASGEEFASSPPTYAQQNPDHHVPEANHLHYSPIKTHTQNLKTNGSSHSGSRHSSSQQPESRNQEMMDIEDENPQNSSLLNMVASHILGAWDSDNICGADMDFHSGRQTKRLDQRKPSPSNREHESMPPPKDRKREEVEVTSTPSYNNWIPETFRTGSDLGSFASGISPAVSMEVDGTCPKEWRATASEVDATSLGSLSSGILSMNENVLNQVPSWEGSVMSAASIQQKDSQSVSSRVRTDIGSETSLNMFPSRDYMDTRLAISLQQQENAAAYEAFKKRYDASLKATSNRTARSSALDRIKAVRDKELVVGDHVRANDGVYVPPDDMSALPQELADHRLAIELQRFEQSRVGTVQQMEKLLKGGQTEEEKSGLRTGRSVYK